MKKLIKQLFSYEAVDMPLTEKFLQLLSHSEQGMSESELKKAMGHFYVKEVISRELYKALYELSRANKIKQMSVWKVKGKGRPKIVYIKTENPY